MANLTIKNLDDGTLARLRERAAVHDRTVEEEVACILSDAVAEPKHKLHLALDEFRDQDVTTDPTANNSRSKTF